MFNSRLVIVIAAVGLVVGAPFARRAPRSAARSCCAVAASLPATPLGSVSFTGGAVNVVLNGTTAYACGQNALGVIDVSNPASPQLLTTFAQSDFGGNAISGCFQYGQSLVVPVNTQSAFVYDISNARNIRSQAQFTPAFPFNGFVSFVGKAGWFTTDWFRYTPGPNTIFEQHGDFAAVDFTDPAHPAPLGSLAVDSAQPASTNLSPRFGTITNGTDTLYIMSTTATGGDTNGGQGAIQLVDVSNPQSPKAFGQILIPQATVLVRAAVQDNIMLVVGNTKSWRNPGVNPRSPGNLNFQFTGVLTLSAVDVTDWRNPALLSSRCSDVLTWTGFGIAPIGGGFFVVAAGPPSDDAVAFGTDPRGQLLLVDARDPTNLGLISLGYVAKLAGVTVSGGNIYAATGDGLAIFQLPDLSGL
jgi:hypothetical protein